MYDVVSLDLTSYFCDNTAAIWQYLHMICLPGIRIFLNLLIPASLRVYYLGQATVVYQVYIRTISNDMNFLGDQIATFEFNLDKVIDNEPVICQYNNLGLPECGHLLLVILHEGLIHLDRSVRVLVKVLPRQFETSASGVDFEQGGLLILIVHVVDLVTNSFLRFNQATSE